MLSTGTLTLGCKSYLDAQARTCFCRGQQHSSTDSNSKSNYKKQYKENTNNNNNNYKQNGKAPPNYGWKDPNDI